MRTSGTLLWLVGWATLLLFGLSVLPDCLSLFDLISLGHKWGLAPNFEIALILISAVIVLCDGIMLFCGFHLARGKIILLPAFISACVALNIVPKALAYLGSVRNYTPAVDATVKITFTSPALTWHTGYLIWAPILIGGIWLYQRRAARLNGSTAPVTGPTPGQVSHSSYDRGVIGVETRLVQPSTRFAVLSFLVGGSLIWMPIYMEYSLVITHPWTLPMVAISGAMLWWGVGVVMPSAWFLTWIPTSAAAVTCAYVLRQLSRADWYVRNRLKEMVCAAIVCAPISGAIYYPCYIVSGIIHPGPPGYKHYLAQHANDYPSSLDQRIMGFGGGVFAVMIIGALLGAWLAWWASRVRSAITETGG